MTNEYGAQLDRAGYAPSIMQPMQPGRCCCYLCGKPAGHEKMDRHEPWGAANRQKSKELGLWVELHHWGCHEGPGSAHASGEVARQLRADAQRTAMLRYGWSRERWIAEFGKSELSEEECLRLIVIPKAVERAVEGAGPYGEPRGTTPQSAAPSAPLTQGSHGAGTRRTVGDIIREFWPDHPTTTHVSSFRIIDGPELPF